jgi:Peptidase family C25
VLVVKFRMKRLFFIIFSLFLALHCFAQVGNEWVRFSQPYYRIPVAKDGLYRLTFTDLQNAGFPVTSTNPLRIQIFHRGTEQRIRVEGELDGVFNAADFIEFYGIKNTGVGDAPLYEPTSVQPHQYYNLYSDSTAYFLTINSIVQPGLRMETFSEVNVGLPAETFHTDEKLQLFTSEYYTGIRYITNVVQNTFFDSGEGWTGPEIFTGGQSDITISNIVNTSQSAGTPILTVQVVGRSEEYHQAEVWIGAASPSRLFGTQVFQGSQSVTLSGNINWSDVSADGKLMVGVRAVGVSGQSDRLSISYIRLTYPQTFNASGSAEKIFTLNANPGNKSYIEIQNAAANTRLFDVTDPANVVPIGAAGSGTLSRVVDNTAASRKILATTTFTTPTLKRVNFRQLDASSAEYVIISNKALMKPAGSYSDPVKAYAAYRASAEGGSYDTLVVDINQLYNQFNYGEISPLAISRFMRYLVNHGDPKYLFIIGKGLDVWYGYHRNPTSSNFTTLKDLVPTAGMPASDIYYTAGIAGNGYEPAVATGRITASTPQDVAAYLNKVKEMANQPFDGLWRKDLLHLSGGLNAGEPEQFKFFLQQYGEIAKGYYLGGSVSAIAKNSTGLQFLDISKKVNAGLNLVTLFGHSSSSQNDVNIGFVSAPEQNYNNQGKYPMFLINGCNAGDFFATTTRYGEDWINTANKGAVGFMANTSFGYTDPLDKYATLFYNIGYGDSTFIHKGVGDIQKEVVRQLTNESSSVQIVAQGQQMLLLGDPAVPLFGANKPDYEVNDDNVFAESFTGEPITALSDSFALKIIVRNFGRASKDTLDIRVTRTLSDNSTVTYDSTFLPILYSDTLTFRILREDKGFGDNTFTVELDPFNKANELTNDNNTAELKMLIPLNAARSLYPQGFAIVNSLTTNLVVQSSNILDEPRDFIIQVDTTDTFDSPYKQEFMVNGKIVTKSINLLPSVDTLAYYWRVRLAQADEDESADWAMTSFTYIEDGEEGWAQVHFPQYMSNEAIGLIKDSQSRKIELQQTITSVDITTFGVNHPGFVTSIPWDRTYHPGLSVKVGGTEYHPISLINETPALGCRKNSINLIAFNKTTALPYMPVAVQYPDVRACGRRPEVITSYQSAEVQSGNGKDLIQYITNVGVGDSVILFSLGSPGYASWSGTVRSKLAELGISSSQIDALQAGEPVVIFGRKGSVPGSALIKRTSAAPVDEQSLLVNASVTGRYVSGEMKSAVIGPATAWDKISFSAAISELPQTDQFTFDVVRITQAGTKSNLQTGVTANEYDLSGLDAVQYPYLQLVFHATDEINLTAPQLKNWIVQYTPAPEGVLTYTGPVAQTFKEGEVFTGTYGFMNISEKTFTDSLLVQYSVFNKTSRTSELRTKKIFAPAPGDETPFNLVFNTQEKAGLNDVRIVVNPRILPEVYYDNNILSLADYLQVQGDVFNPVLEVTIDGRYIVNGDYVSPNPAIRIRLWDENPIVLKTDTTGIRIFLYPCASAACDAIPIYFTREDVAWFPATATNDFRVEFNPRNLAEGTYTLRVEAADTRGNPSGTEPYEITFVVLMDNSVVIQRPYPNPSQDNVFFPIIIAGDEQPDNLVLELMNANGQLINVFTKNDLFIGTNVLQWDRQNASGITVPPGMYLYRMVVTRNGRDVKTANGKLILR